MFLLRKNSQFAGFVVCICGFCGRSVECTAPVAKAASGLIGAPRENASFFFGRFKGFP